MLCSLSREAKCNHCRSFNLSRDILLGSANQKTKEYLNNFIADFLNLSDTTYKTFISEVKIEKVEKINYKKSEKNRTQIIKQVLPSFTCSGQFQHGRWKRKFYY